ncbi:hypothetical protein E3C22_05185 [Jiella endophytica]|uniref:Uncharacterized protein n=2 Tax=Jiella endophytica TaxID=2558362 RepID=A0A4Y8RPS8_9HYPH|nr:hypothetical protein [Jiella endophytica]TFF25652.1 hypothetical protein E3C22_05185 [Jiella endophytica]
MTKLLDRAFDRIRALPEEAQDVLAHELLQMTGEEQPVHRLAPDEKASMAASMEEAARGQFASDGEVRAVWAKHGL